MLGVFEEQVGTEGNLIAHRAAEQVHQRHLQVMRLQVKKRHFKGRIGVAHRFAGMGAGGQFRPRHAPRFIGRHCGLHNGPQLIEIERIETYELLLQLLLDGQCRSIAVALAQANVAIVALDFDDRTQGIGLVNSAGIEQRRVPEGDGGDSDTLDFQEAAPAGSVFKALCRDGVMAAQASGWLARD